MSRACQLKRAFVKRHLGRLVSIDGCGGIRAFLTDESREMLAVPFFIFKITP
jgi:hypothetical protein